MILDQKNVAIRTGHHCAQPLMKYLNIASSARASFGVYNNKNDVDLFVNSLVRSKKIFNLISIMKDKDLNDFLPDKSTSYFNEFNVANSNITIAKEQVIAELRKVMDPEIPVNLYDLGLIYKIEIDPT